MNYQVWIKDEYSDSYTKVDCGDLPAVKREIEKAIREGKEPFLTIEVPYKYDIEIGGVGSEAIKSKAKPGKSAGAESEGEVRPGRAEAPGGLDKGLGDNDPDNSVPSK